MDGRVSQAFSFGAGRRSRQYATFSFRSMRIFYSSLSAIEQQTSQLEFAICRHCQQDRQLVSHGFVYKKLHGGKRQAVGKRVFCSDRGQRFGCGRTMQLYLDSVVHGMHYAGQVLIAFMAALMIGLSVQHAYRRATGAAECRHAWVWLNRLEQQLSTHRTYAHQAPLRQRFDPAAQPRRPPRFALFASTWQQLQEHLGQPLCSRYQFATQRSFL
jgi:hypothetical protein